MRARCWYIISVFHRLIFHQIKKYLKEKCQTASFSSDGWTSRAGVSFTSIMLHLIDAKFNFVTFCLAVKEIEGVLVQHEVLLIFVYR